MTWPKESGVVRGKRHPAMRLGLRDYFMIGSALRLKADRLKADIQFWKDAIRKSGDNNSEASRWSGFVADCEDDIRRCERIITLLDEYADRADEY